MLTFSSAPAARGVRGSRWPAVVVAAGWVLPLVLAGEAAQAQAQAQAPVSTAAAPTPLPAPLGADAARDCQALSAAQPWRLLGEAGGGASAPPSAAWKALPTSAAWLDAQHLRLPASAVPKGAALEWRWVAGAALPQRLALGEPLAAAVPSTAPSWSLLLQPMGAVPATAPPGPIESALRMTSALGAGTVWRLAEPPDAATLRQAHRWPQALVGVDADGTVRAAMRLQSALAWDALWAEAAEPHALGAIGQPMGRGLQVRWQLWAPTARAVWACVGMSAHAEAALQAWPMQRDDASGIWKLERRGVASGTPYTYLVEVFMPEHGWVRNRVTDPYAVSLTADSARSAVLDLHHPNLQPRGWRAHRRPSAPASAVDMVISELHVRDFSASDPKVPPAHRGRYLAFTQAQSQGVRHLRSMAAAGLTDVHLLPIFDWATAPEQACRQPEGLGRDLRLPVNAPQAALEAQAQWVGREAAADCYNWGYDPWHFNAPEGSFSSQAQDPAARVRETRAMVMALHGMGLRVGMDVVYNHLSASGLHPKSVLDRIVPGYYHRLNAQGQVERSTCCDNSATEHRMMRKLMIDSTVHWVQHYAIDSFRFDLMGHQPREAMQALQRSVDAAAGRRIPLIGEGWNFGEIADGARFVQASQDSLGGTGIGTFNDRLRDAARGTKHGDSPSTTVQRQGWLTASAHGQMPDPALADVVRAGLAGSLANVRLTLGDGRSVNLGEWRDGGVLVGYGKEPTEVVNYVENHDNPTLYDLLAFKLPLTTPARRRAERQALGSALVLWAQGVPYLHAGQEILRSKSMDLNSYDSGDAFNLLDFSRRSHGLGVGLPPGGGSAPFRALIEERLRQPWLRPQPSDLDWSLGVHLDAIAVRRDTPLLRLRSAREVERRLHFPTAAGLPPSVVLVWIDGGAGIWAPTAAALGPHAGVLLAFNTDEGGQQVELSALRGRALSLHPMLARADATDRRLREQARWGAESGQLFLPPRSAAVWVLPHKPTDAPK